MKIGKIIRRLVPLFRKAQYYTWRFWKNTQVEESFQHHELLVKGVDELERHLKPPKLVQQKADKHDCLIACMAMVMRIDYREIAELLGSTLTSFIQHNGSYNNKLHEIFTALGMNEGEDYQWVVGFSSRGFSLPVLYIWKREAILKVPSKNYKTLSHFVYWDGDKIYDPSLKAVYTTEEIKHTAIEHVILFNTIP